jgi:hypothetical protein
VVVLLGDHGPAHQDDQNEPFLSLLVPLPRLEDTESTERGLWATLEKNEARLVTHYDLFLTLKHVVAMWGQPVKSSCYTSDSDRLDDEGRQPRHVEGRRAVDHDPHSTTTTTKKTRCAFLAKDDPAGGIRELEHGSFYYRTVTPQHHAQSLFTAIPARRTCDQAGILRHHCYQGSEWKPLSLLPSDRRGLRSEQVKEHAEGGNAKDDRRRMFHVTGVNEADTVARVTRIVREVLRDINDKSVLHRSSCAELTLGTLLNITELRVNANDVDSVAAAAELGSPWWSGGEISHDVRFRTNEGPLEFLLRFKMTTPAKMRAILDGDGGDSDSNNGGVADNEEGDDSPLAPEFSLFSLNQLTRYHPYEACTPEGVSAEFCLCRTKAAAAHLTSTFNAGASSLPHQVALPFGGLVFRKSSSWDRDRDALLHWGKVRVAESVQLSLGPRGPQFTMRRGVEPGEVLLESDPSSIIALDDGSAIARKFAPLCRSGDGEVASGNESNASNPGGDSVHTSILSAAGRLCAELGEAHGINCVHVTRTINLWRLLVDASQEEQGRQSGKSSRGVLSKDKRPFLHLILHTDLEPYVWQASGVDWLHGSEWAAGLQQALAQQRVGMTWVCDVLLPKLWEMFPNDSGFSQEAYTCEGYYWTETIYTTRSMMHGVMVPLHINLDHDPENANVVFVDPNGGYRATAGRRIRSGEVLLGVYGHHSNWRLQASYDFVLARGSNAAYNRVRLEPCQLGRALGTSHRCAAEGLLANLPGELARRSPMPERGVRLASHLDHVVDPETLMILTLFSAEDEEYATVVQATERRGWQIAEATRLSALPACVCALKRWAAWMLADTKRWLEGRAPARVPPTRRQALRQLAEETIEILANVLGLIAAEQSQCAEEVSLESLAGASGSDKARVGNGNGHHGYTRYYERIFKPLRKSAVRIVEIGVERGASMKMWQQYFSEAEHVYGIGYGNFQKTPSQDCDSDAATRVDSKTACTIYKGDQSDIKFLNHFIEKTGGNFDVIIDDGSHVPSHQLVSFETLWSSVKPGGVYIVEDVETNWWKPTAQMEVYGYSLQNQPNVVEIWKGVIDSVNREFTDGHSKLTDEKPEVYGSVASIEFGQNIIIFHKALEGEESMLSKKYRLPGFLP